MDDTRLSSSGHRGAIEPRDMTDARDLRKKAALCRRAASISTEGGGQADRYLVELAEELERQADALDQATKNEKKR